MFDDRGRAWLSRHEAVFSMDTNNPVCCLDRCMMKMPVHDSDCDCIKDVYSGVCLDKKGEFCAEEMGHVGDKMQNRRGQRPVRASQCQDPDGAGDVTGKEVRVTTSCTKLHNSNVIGNTLAAFTGWQVLEEDVRQLCIHEATKAQQSAFAMLPISQFSSQLPSASYNAPQKSDRLVHICKIWSAKGCL